MSETETVQMSRPEGEKAAEDSRTPQPGGGSDAPSEGRASLGKHYAFREHVLLPLPSKEQMAEDLRTPAGTEQLTRFLNARAERLRLAEVDPVHHRLRLKESAVVDGLLEKYQVVYESGGKRAGKTEDGVPRFLLSCLTYPRKKAWAMQENITTSVATLQQTFWKYLPESIKRLASKRPWRGAKHRVVYTPANGFDKLLVLPNGTEIHFLTYQMDTREFLGWELGKPVEVPLVVLPGLGTIPDIGAYLDEGCTKAWFDNVLLRCSTRGAKVHWTYSPQEGITLTIKDVKSGTRLKESRPSPLLGERVNVPGCPKGHMPYIETDEARGIAVFYRFTEWNPFSGYEKPGGVKQLCEGKPTDYVMRHAYGYCEDVKGRVFPLFGDWNIVGDADLPAEGTNWMVTDPAGSRNWFTLWARVSPGNPSEVYIYREWPDYGTYGEWARTSENPRRVNGERGPAQPTIGYGPAEYKKLFRRLERIVVPEGVKVLAGRANREKGTEQGGEEDKAAWDCRTPKPAAPGEQEWEEALRMVKDPQHRAVIRRAYGNGEIDQSLLTSSPTEEELYEEIFERLLDPRAAKSQSASERGGVCVQSKLAEVSYPDGAMGKGGEVVPPMYFVGAPGLEIADGVSQINELLWFNRDKEVVRLLNGPRLLVHESCRNLIWALRNYSLPNDGGTGSDDACEDPIDCLRYLVTRGVRYVMAGGRVKTSGGGSY